MHEGVGRRIGAASIGEERRLATEMTGHRVRYSIYSSSAQHYVSLGLPCREELQMYALFFHAEIHQLPLDVQHELAWST
jgi:hypothetical protein